MATRRIGTILSPRKYSSSILCLRHLSNNDATHKRTSLFSKELARQKKLTSRVEKIQVELEDPSYGCTMIMNKNISTPYDCCRHINQMLTQRSVLAVVDGKHWDIHRPLESDCKIRLLHFKSRNPFQCNLAYWRSCSFLLGYALERAFKEDFFVELYGWPKPDLSSGSFVLDANLKMDNWEPKPEELRTLSGYVRRTVAENLKFERLAVSKDLAQEIFEDNRYKSKQIPNIIAQTTERGEEPKIVLYRLGDHIDISCGPMISNTSHIGKFSVTAAHRVEIDGETLYRFQGVSIPNGMMLNHFAYSILVDRAKELNCGTMERVQEPNTTLNELGPADVKQQKSFENL